MWAKIIFSFLICFISCFRYPIYEEIRLSKMNKKPKSIIVTQYDDYLNYIKKYNYIFAYFYSEFCDECDEFLPILEESSKYKIINRNWVLIKIDCSQVNDVCQYLGVEQFPYYERHRKQEQVELMELPNELTPFLELLFKLCTEPIVQINSKEEFFEYYSFYAPIVEIEKPKIENKTIVKKIKKENYDEEEDEDEDEDEEIVDIKSNENENEKENDFMECIKKIANNEFLQTYYFGVTETKDNKEKIVFDNGNYPTVYLWDGVCQNAIKFLNANKYPLLYNVDKYYIKELNEEEESRVLVTLMTFTNNSKITNFISTDFKKLAYENREYLFGYVDYEIDKDVFNNSMSFYLNDTNEMQLIIYDFLYKSYYVHNEVFKIGQQNEKQIINEIEKLLLNITNLNFETGSKFQDFINFIGFNKMTTTKQVIVIIILLMICLGTVYIFGDDNDYLDDDLYDYEEVEEVTQPSQIPQIAEAKTVKVI